MQACQRPPFEFRRGATSPRRTTSVLRGRFAAGVLMLAVGLTSCGGDDGTSGASGTGDTTDAQDATDTEDAADTSDAESSDPGEAEVADDGEAGDADGTDDTTSDDSEAGDGEAGTTDRADRYDEAPELTIDVDADYQARVETSLGVIEADLFAQEAPVTVNSFVFLARDGYFDGLIFHRVIPEFVAQGGDPRGDGTGGPGYAFEDELEVAERQGYGLGTLAMANSGPDTNGSQFFFTVDDVDLPPLYSVFGQVTSGLEVLEAIAAQPTGPGDRPVDDIRIVSVEIAGP